MKKTNVKAQNINLFGQYTNNEQTPNTQYYDILEFLCPRGAWKEDSEMLQPC